MSMPAAKPVASNRPKGEPINRIFGALQLAVILIAAKFRISTNFKAGKLLMNTASSIHLATPQAGDIIFVKKKKKRGMPIASFQKLKGVPHREYVHVAIVVSINEIMEAQLNKTAEILGVEEWKRGRDDSEEFLILRHPEMESEEKHKKIVESAAYWHGEAYALLDAIASKPITAGRSICSVLAAKVLWRAGLLDSELVVGDRQIYPGGLLDYLKSINWIEVNLNGNFTLSKKDGLILEKDSSYFSPLTPNSFRRVSSMTTINSISSNFDDIISASININLATEKEIIDNFDKHGALPCFASIVLIGTALPLGYICDMIKVFIGLYLQYEYNEERDIRNWKAASRNKEHEQSKKDGLLYHDRMVPLFVEKYREAIEKTKLLQFADENTEIIDEFLRARKGNNYTVDVVMRVHKNYRLTCIKFYFLTGVFPANKFDKSQWQIHKEEIDRVKNPEVREIFESLINTNDASIDCLNFAKLTIESLREILTECYGHKGLAEIDAEIEKKFENAAEEFRKESKGNL